MKTLLWSMVFAILGGVLGAFLALGFGASVGVTSGLIQGAQVATCTAVETAREQGLFADDRQADELISATIQRVRAKAGELPTGATTTWVSDAAACQELLIKIETGASPFQP